MSQIAVKVLLQFCSLALQLRGLHYGGVPLGLKTTGRLLLSVHSDFLSEQLAFWLRAVELARAGWCFLLAVIELLSRIISPRAGCVSLCLATQETGITSGPALNSDRQWELNSPNDGWLANGLIHQGLGVKLASCSSRERNPNMGTYMICETLNTFGGVHWVPEWKWERFETEPAAACLALLVFSKVTLCGLKAVVSRWTVGQLHDGYYMFILIDTRQQGFNSGLVHTLQVSARFLSGIKLRNQWFCCCWMF